MPQRVERECEVCGSNDGFNRGDDGLFYCRNCNAAADDIFDTGVEEEHVFNHYSQSCNRVRPTNISVSQPISQVKLSQGVMNDGLGPTEPSDFGFSERSYSYEDYYTEIRSRYVMGLQTMIQLQARVLVEKFNVSPLIIGLVGPLWLRFLASTKIMADEWADQAVHDSESQVQGGAEEFRPSANYTKEIVNIHGKRVATVWYKSLRSRLSISYSLAISFLVCHVAREPILPTDILKWALEGKLPYFSAFVEIEKKLGSRSGACPISVSRMLRPTQPISSQKLESMAADIAQKIGLKLPPVNFHAIASRYLRELSLPTGELLPAACNIFEWSMPSELYLSANEFRIPTRAYVMSILIVAIRIQFDINGYGIWESSREDDEFESNGDNEISSHDSEPPMCVLQLLEGKYYELADVHEYSADLPAYLQYCKDVVFSGLNPSFEDFEEKKLIDELWAYYENNKRPRTSDDEKRSNEDSGRRNQEARNNGDQSSCSTSSKSDDDDCSKCSTDRKNCSHRDQASTRNGGITKESPKEKAIKQLMLDMEENHFCYISPRVKVKRRDYLHYARKRKDVLIYAVHADYYILLRCCAKIALVETRIMHMAVLGLERRLNWLEKKIDTSLINLDFDDVCEFCEGDLQNSVIHSIG